MGAICPQRVVESESPFGFPRPPQLPYRFEGGAVLARHIAQRALVYNDETEGIIADAERHIGNALYNERRERLVIENCRDDSLERAVALLRAFWEVIQETERR